MTPSGRSLQRDYTQGDNYDYFEHKTPGSAIDKPMIATRTVTDRTVFGGDGIQPDELTTRNGEEDAAGDALADPLFFYVRDMMNSGYAGTFRTVALTNEVDPIAGFLAFVKGDPVWKPAARSILSRTQVVRSRLRYEFTLAASGALNAARVLINDDPDVVKAIEALPRSAELAQTAERVRRSQKR
jgi:carboxyl-terminal processing protease